MTVSLFLDVFLMNACDKLYALTKHLHTNDISVLCLVCINSNFVQLQHDVKRGNIKQCGCDRIMLDSVHASFPVIPQRGDGRLCHKQQKLLD